MWFSGDGLGVFLLRLLIAMWKPSSGFTGFAVLDGGLCSVTEVASFFSSLISVISVVLVFFFKYIYIYFYLFIWLYWVLVVACKLLIVVCGI